MNYSSRVAFDHWRWGNHNRSLVFSKKHLVQLEKMIDPIKTIYIQVPKKTLLQCFENMIEGEVLGETLPVDADP